MPEYRAHYRAGVVASLLAETGFILLEGIISPLLGMDPWMVVRMPGSFLLGPEAVEPAGLVTGDVMIGLLMHLSLAVLVGVLYAALLPRLRVSPVTGGLLAGAVLYVLGFWVLPLLFPVWLAPFWLPPLQKAMQAVTHLVYGWMFGYAYQRLRSPGRAEPASA